MAMATIDAAKTPIESEVGHRATGLSLKIRDLRLRRQIEKIMTKRMTGAIGIMDLITDGKEGNDIVLCYVQWLLIAAKNIFWEPRQRPCGKSYLALLFFAVSNKLSQILT